MHVSDLTQNKSGVKVINGVSSVGLGIISSTRTGSSSSFKTDFLSTHGELADEGISPPLLVWTPGSTVLFGAPSNVIET